MKILDFNHFKPLENALNKMGTDPNVEYSHSGSWKHISREELKLLNTRGIELSIEQLENCICEDGTFEWKGQKVLVYIKDQWVKSDYQTLVYKYHIANCSTQIQMRAQGRIDRYVISTRKDGVFQITLRDIATRNVIKENIERPLNVCKNCLHTLQSSYPIDRGFFNFIAFKLETYLDKYNTQIRYMPKFNNKTVPVNDYPDNWDEISKRYRKSKGWTCEKCNLDCSDNKKNLHCHHIGPKYDSNHQNLQALCISCHKLEPGHMFMNNGFSKAL